jgi:hypothetical protein
LIIACSGEYPEVGGWGKCDSEALLQSRSLSSDDGLEKSELVIYQN